MKGNHVCIFLFACSAFVFSQSAYQQCYDQCIASGLSPATCASEACNPADTAKTVQTGQGNPLQLFSYELRGPAPVIDGSLMSRDGDPATAEAKDEWKKACSRTIMLSDSTPVQLFLVNSADTLYVGVTYEHNNNGDGSSVRLLFDEGAQTNSGRFAGNADNRLGAAGVDCWENGCSVTKSGGAVLKQDFCWNGSSWAVDADNQNDFAGGRYYYNSDLKVHHNEFAIPLHNGKPGDLNVDPNGAIGFYIEVVKMGAGAGTFHWIETNGNPERPDTFPYWGRIQLSVQRGFFTLYTGRSPTAPVIDGAISEPAWNGAYQRELMLSNFHYGYFRSKIWCLQDTAQKYIYLGLRVFDNQHNPLDNCQVFLEGPNDSSSSMRNYTLESNGENELKASSGGQPSDYYWNMSQGGWATDPVSTDSQAAAAGETSDYTDYEFKILRAGGMYNVDIAKNGLLGLQIRYHDADRVGDFSDFYWEYTTNNDAQLLDQQTHPYVYIATGWANLQLGGSYLQVVSPASGDSIHGVVPVQVNAGSDSLASVVCFLSGDTAHQVALVYQGNGIWSGSIDATNAIAGELLVIRAVSASGVTCERVVNTAHQVAGDIRMANNSPQPPCERFRATPTHTGIDFSFNLAGSGAYSIAVYTIAGKQLWRYAAASAARGGQHVHLDAAAARLSDGTYLVRLTMANKTASGRFVVVP